MYTGVHWNVSQGKWLHFQRSKPLSSKQELPWCGLDVSVCFIQAQTITIDCGNKLMLTWWIQEEALKWRNFSVLAILKVRELVLQLIHKRFSIILNADMPTLWATWVKEGYSFRSLVYTIISVQTTPNHVFSWPTGHSWISTVIVTIVATTLLAA